MKNNFIQTLYQYIDQPENKGIENVNFEIILKAYIKQGYSIDKTFEGFLQLVFDKQVKYSIDKKVNILDFRLKKVLKDYPKYIIQSLEEKYHLEEIIPFAEIYNGYMVIVKDKRNYVYGIYDHLVLMFGKSIVEGLENILNNNEISRLSE